MPTTNNLVLIENEYHTLRIAASFRPGRGELQLYGASLQGAQNALVAAVSTIAKLENYVDHFDSAIFGERDLSIRVGLDDSTTIPVVGESYGLGLAIAILSAAARKSPPTDIVFTGCLGPAGEVLPVEGIIDKRRAAKRLGYEKIMLPGSQLDMFNTDILQCPVHSIEEAFSVTFYE